MPAASTFAFWGSPQPRQGFARSARRWRGLDSASALHTEGIYRSGGGSRRKEKPMTERSLTPYITVTIGHHSRIYFAFVTTAPHEFDSPRPSRCTRRRLRMSSASPRSRSRWIHPALAYQRAWCSWMRWNSRGSERSTGAISIHCFRQITVSSDSTRCSTGSGNGFRPRHPARSLHDSHTHVRVNRSPRRRAFQEVPSWSSRSFRTTKPTRRANSRMRNCTSPMACSTA